MVKGVQKRVIVLNMEREALFEQAIFVVRPGVTGDRGVSEAEVLREATRAAEAFVRKNRQPRVRRLQKIPAPAIAAAGAAASGLAWLALHLIGVS